MSPELLAELNNAAVQSSEALDRERKKLAHMNDPEQRRVQSLRIQAAAVERDRCLKALFSSEPSNSR